MTRLVKISKYLCYHLRHRPDRLGLELAPGGWVNVDKLLKTAKKHNFPITREELQQIVKQDDKKRFSFNTEKDLIRANQGHSVSIDLELEPASPPSILYHGTYRRAVSSIMVQGLKKMSRHHVHLSSDIETARRVGARRGHPVIFKVDTLAMSQNGYKFYLSDNEIWLTESVPADFLKPIER